MTFFSIEEVKFKSKVNTKCQKCFLYVNGQVQPQNLIDKFPIRQLRPSRTAVIPEVLSKQVYVILVQQYKMNPYIKYDMVNWKRIKCNWDYFSYDSTDIFQGYLFVHVRSN